MHKGLNYSPSLARPVHFSARPGQARFLHHWGPQHSFDCLLQRATSVEPTVLYLRAMNLLSTVSMGISVLLYFTYVQSFDFRHTVLLEISVMMDIAAIEASCGLLATTQVKNTIPYLHTSGDTGLQSFFTSDLLVTLILTLDLQIRTGISLPLYCNIVVPEISHDKQSVAK